jgi:hypothetical protein
MIFNQGGFRPYSEVKDVGHCHLILALSNMYNAKIHPVQCIGSASSSSMQVDEKGQKQTVVDESHYQVKFVHSSMFN